MKFGICLLFLVSFSIAQAHGQECNNLREDASRLACYDSKYGDLIVSSNKGNWRLSESRSKLDDTKNVYLSVVSNDAYKAEFGKSHRPTLWLRCSENTTSFFIDSDGDYLSDNRLNPLPVLRIDKKKAREYRMSVSTDNRALGLWRGGNSISFIKKMFRGSTLLVQYTPVSDSARTFTFNIGGLEEAITPLRGACKW